MAGTVSPNMSTISMCDVTTGWTAAGGTNAQNIDVYLEGSACLQNYNSGAAARGADYDLGAGGTSLTNQNIYCWFSMSNKNNIPIKGASGMRIRLTDTSANWAEWDIFGKDTVPHGGWLSWAIRTTVTADRNGGTAPNLALIRYVGWRCGTATTTVVGKTAIYFDAFRYGIGLNLYAGTQGSPATFDDLITSENTNFYGVASKSFGIYYLTGQLNIGSTSAGQATYFQDSSKVVVFKDIPVGSGFYNLKLQGNATGDTQVYFGTKSGSDGISGFTLRCESESQTPKFNLTASDTNVNKYGIYGSTVNSSDIIYGQAYNANRSFVSCNFEKCPRLEPSTGVVDRCFFLSTTGRAILMNSTSHNITNCSFINCQTGIHISTAGSYTFTNLKFSGNTYDLESDVSGTDIITQTDTRDTDQPLGNGTVTAIGESFSGTGAALANVVFTLSKGGATGLPTGNLTAKIYASTGGSGSYVPTGTALATSPPFDVSTLTASPTATTIYFAMQNQNITITSGTQNYVAVLEYSGGDASNFVNVGIDSTSPTYAGNLATYASSTWTAQSTKDAIFKVRTGGIITITPASGSNPSASKINNSAAIPGCVTINTGVNLTVNVKNASQTNITGAKVIIFETNNSVNVLLNTTTDGSGNATASITLAAGTSITVRARLSTSGGTRYFPAETTTTVPSTDSTLNVTLTRDTIAST